MQSRKNLTLSILAFACLALLVFPLCAQAQEAAAPAAPTAEVAKSTLDNLMAAFNGESNANAKYLAYAKKADEEGYAQVASLFRAAARAEQVHFEHHAAIIQELGGKAEAKIETHVVKSTKENLEDSIAGETYETTTMYPEFLAKAEVDKIEKAIDAFEDAGKAEAVHAKLYKEALSNLDAWKTGKKDFNVCPVCGNVATALPDPCPICGTKKEEFITVS